MTAFVALAVVTVAAFFITQHLKVSTPLINGRPAPHPAQINPVNGQVCHGVSHRAMFISFYLQNRSDDVDVYMVDTGGNIVATLASGVHMVGGRHPVRRGFEWNGRLADGQVAPDGTYYVKVSLIHEGRSVLISDNAGALPVTVDTVAPHPRVVSVTPSLIPRAGVRGALVRTAATQGLPARMLIYRTDLPGRPRLVKSFPARRSGATSWDGTVAGGAPAPQGTYLVGLRVTDRACNTGSFPAVLPPVPGTTAHAGVSVRYLAGLPPLTPVAPGRDASVFVDARQHAYAWALRPAGTHGRPLTAGHSRAIALTVPLTGSGRARGPSGTGLFELALRYGAHRTLVPLVGPVPGGGSTKVLIVVPALTWQGLNPVDDDGDGVPNTLSGGYPVGLARPLVTGLPAGWSQLVALLRFCRRNRLAYQLTTDLGLVDGAGPQLAGHAGVVLAGDERWVPPALATALRAYVAGGGHVLSLGIDSLRRGVTLSRAQASHPTAPRAADLFGARYGPVVPTHGAFVLAGHDGLGLFRTTSGAFRFAAYQSYTGLTAPLTVASSAGTTGGSSAIIGFHDGRGVVIDVGIPGFASLLGSSTDAQEILTRIWTVLAR
ncbi:MAG TPA: FlgD immunoglobulin-like domain containing protein [Solirubrobacteraceae bacterium]|nr:FlgD immunoglobulin-like domain containing protein [Solirubrobacteraceae bacterium]